MQAWVVRAKELSHYALWRLEPYSFMVIIPGAALSYLHGYGTDYYLLDKKFEPALTEFYDQVSTHPASIWNKAKQETLTNYVELKIKNRVGSTISFYGQQPRQGLDIWLYGGVLMISDNLKNMWQNLPGNDLEFDPNPPVFAANE